jgi:hypothetical protein
VFPVRYGLDVYVLFTRDSVFKELIRDVLFSEARSLASRTTPNIENQGLLHLDLSSMADPTKS